MGWQASRFSEERRTAAEDPLESGEASWHRRARRQRQSARAVLAIANARQLLAGHHGGGTAMPKHAFRQYVSCQRCKNSWVFVDHGIKNCQRCGDAFPACWPALGKGGDGSSGRGGADAAPPPPWKRPWGAMRAGGQQQQATTDGLATAWQALAAALGDALPPEAGEAVTKLVQAADEAKQQKQVQSLPDSVVVQSSLQKLQQALKKRRGAGESRDKVKKQILDAAALTKELFEQLPVLEQEWAQAQEEVVQAQQAHRAASDQAVDGAVAARSPATAAGGGSQLENFESMVQQNRLLLQQVQKLQEALKAMASLPVAEAAGVAAAVVAEQLVPSSDAEVEKALQLVGTITAAIASASTSGEEAVARRG